MAGLFASIPVRARTDGKVLVGWWNALRTAGIFLENFVGTISTAWTSFTFANNQAATNVTGALLDSSTSKAAHIEVTVRRYTTTNRSNCWVDLYAVYDSTAAAWVLCDQNEHGDASGVTWTLSGAQLQYASDNMTGSGYSGVSSFRITAI